MVLIRISEIFQAFPQLVLVMMLVAIVNKRGLGNLLFIFVFTGWMTTFRMVRNEFMSLKNETYVKVCEAFGMKKSNIMFKQILPNVMSPVIVSTTTNVAFFILQEAALSFIGLGVADSTPTMGEYFKCGEIRICCHQSVVDLGVPGSRYQSFCPGNQLLRRRSAGCAGCKTAVRRASWIVKNIF